MEYMCLQLLVTSHDSVWDRCIYSNLIFYYVHNLMFKFQTKEIPHNVDIVWPILNSMAHDTNLLSTIDFCKRIKNIPTIFFVCRDVGRISESLFNRAISTNAVNDLWNCTEYNYQMAQYHVYLWFGKLCKFPVFDLMDFIEENYTIDDMHTMIASKIDRDVTTTECILPNRDAAKTLNDLLSPLADDVLIYDYSKK
ncbi:GrBNV gp34-like protein [Tomelloso virus]|uniref:GrBNV gp34-like protein n=1 Tax=Tomelloso virus TaxID=2053981 RepID=A0A2H4T2T0_9VIRU|nr:GrBNV gp34-like protein [Tomelloso virus]ATY70241.1 GrBNV gp34-like protein [Tomelloso virus]